MSFRRSLKYDPWQLQVLLKAACELFDFFLKLTFRVSMCKMNICDDKATNFSAQMIIFV